MGQVPPAGQVRGWCAVDGGLHEACDVGGDGTAVIHAQLLEDDAAGVLAATPRGLLRDLDLRLQIGGGASRHEVGGFWHEEA